MTCTKCGQDKGPGSCPVYHGMTGDGFCPAFWDGETALETATRLHDEWLTATRENAKLHGEVRRLKERGLLARLFGNITQGVKG